MHATSCATYQTITPHRLPSKLTSCCRPRRPRRRYPRLRQVSSPPCSIRARRSATRPELRVHAPYHRACSPHHRSTSPCSPPPLPKTSRRSRPNLVKVAKLVARAIVRNVPKQPERSRIVSHPSRSPPHRLRSLPYPSRSRPSLCHMLKPLLRRHVRRLAHPRHCRQTLSPRSRHTSSSHPTTSRIGSPITTSQIRARVPTPTAASRNLVRRVAHLVHTSRPSFIHCIIVPSCRASRIPSRVIILARALVCFAARFDRRVHTSSPHPRLYPSSLVRIVCACLYPRQVCSPRRHPRLVSRRRGALSFSFTDTHVALRRIFPRSPSSRQRLYLARRLVSRRLALAVVAITRHTRRVPSARRHRLA